MSRRSAWSTEGVPGEVLKLEQCPILKKKRKGKERNKKERKGKEKKTKQNTGKETRQAKARHLY